MNVAEIIQTIRDKGVCLSPVGDRIKAERTGGLDDEVRRLIRNNKAEIFRQLQEIPTEPLLKPCSICGERNFIHGHAGGYYCVSCQPNARPGVSVRADGNW